MSVRLKLTLSYAGFLFVAGAVIFVSAWFAGRNPRSYELLWDIVPSWAIRAVGAVVPGNDSFLLRAFAPAVLVALVFLLLVGLLGGWVIAGRMLAPLDRITDATRQAAEGSLAHRIRLPGRQDEFRELADTFDTMLARLEAHVEEQQRFAANASHELRTPLAVTQTLLDVARKDPERDSGELVERLHAVNTRAIDLTEALLLLSRADRRSFAREPIDISLVAEEATETLLPLAEERSITVETSGEGAQTVGSFALLLQLATNLVHNAIVHNRPEHGWVRVTTLAEPEAVALTVENTGDPVSPALVSTLVEPFQRGSRRIHHDHAGVGLGLAIVKSISEAHDGSLVLTPRAEGGLVATVRLPRAPAQSAQA
jgi:two-component system sensor histidine kinase VanS